MKFDRIWHPIWLWEEINTPMWTGPDRCTFDECIDFTGDHKKYGLAMNFVVQNWKISCENSLTNYRINRKAWLGHAACAMKIGATEKMTRKAWAFLNETQRTLANREAARHICEWEGCYAKSIGIHENMEEPLLF